MKKAGFNPRALFAASEPGAWYDPSDMSTLFQDSAGTTPCYQPGQGQVDPPVGRILDKSGRGNHATQTTTTSRPTLSARYNLLTKSDQFADVVWIKTRCAVTANAGLAPDGSLAASKLVEDTSATATHAMQGQILTLQAVLHTCTVYLKAAERSWALLRVGASSANFFAYFNLANGVIGNAGAGTTFASIISVGDGWYRCQVTGTPAAASDYALSLFPAAGNGGVTYSGDGTSGIYIWGADIRPANDGVGLPPYQRVVDANTYDTTGFPLYLKFDGVDDFLQTASVDFSGTDKLFVSAALRKLSDAAAGIVVELSLVSNSNPGAFALLAPSGANPTMGVYLRGATTLVTKNALSGIASPASGVLTGVFDLAAITQQARIRINGQPAGGSASSDAGGGVFGSYPLYVGKRGLNASTMFNGRLYGLLIRGAATPDATIAAVESYLNSKARIY